MSTHSPSHAEMQAAFAARDRAWDGRFVIGVVTTRVYCRPSCPARRPNPENTRFLLSGAEALDAGFRPCKRCRPDEVARDVQAVRQVIGILRETEGPVALARLARATGYSPSHLQRIFTRLTGLSPAAYGRALRDKRACNALAGTGAGSGAGSGSVTAAIYEAGFESPSRFYDSMQRRLGMTPSAWAKGGAGATIRWAVAASSLGPVLVAATEKGVCCLSFGEDRAELDRLFPNATLVEGDCAFAALVQEVVAAVDDPSREHAIPLDVQGTAFQERIWAELRKIPPGETRSYAELAAAAGYPRAVRAAGSANGANPVAVLIPCHRVIRADGSLGGYGFGPETKRELLAREGVQTKL
ncbi:bifunctional transcriptional activator/DNA repair enzyme AdaA [Altericroceibacterium xinjiangense]|uniref:bifunctional transcriptional activator/DNA repair enzyme AdaA n=1 Tax=Altericroceibacterium xinjiangense TaxID=762261 RepID=UPI000F7E31E5|nr:methylated-DNA--[protein]-cysteine S-methyltransferase [Altericroceibacterium xinjiangense]